MISLSKQVRDIEILLVEDNPADVDLTTDMLSSAKIANRVSVANDGVEAMRFLRRVDGYSDAPRPDLVLLDLNLPRKDGRAVLKEIKQDPQLRSVPVVILTSSQADADIARSYDLHANCYISKPVRLEEFARVIASLNDFWLKVVKLPPNHGTAEGS